MSYEPIWKTFRLFALYDMGINFSTLHIATHLPVQRNFMLSTMYNGSLVNPTSINGFPLTRYGDKTFRHFWRYLMGTHYLCNLTGHYADLDILYSHNGNLDQADFHSTVLWNQIWG